MIAQVIVTGEDVAALHIRLLGERAVDLRPVFRVIFGQLEEAQEQWFESRGRGRWPALAQYTIEDKAKRGETKMLVAEGKLRKSLTQRRARGAKREMTRDEMQFGSTLGHLHLHEYGTVKMPARPPMRPVGVRERQRMVALIRSYVMGKPGAGSKV